MGGGNRCTINIFDSGISHKSFRVYENFFSVDYVRGGCHTGSGYSFSDDSEMFCANESKKCGGGYPGGKRIEFMKVLLVEDDAIISEGLQYSLRQEGYEVAAAATQKEALALIQSERVWDFCLLDVMLPDGDGFALCREIRKNSQTPILFITACDDEVHTVMALEQGADDYITKPFRIRELMARMKAILRRTGQKERMDSAVSIVGRNQVNLQTGKIYCGNEEVILTAMEYKLLLIFLNHRGQTLTRQQILNNIWDDVGDYVNDNTLSVYIKRLRKKLGDSPEGQIIKTVRGTGYRMEK